MDFAQFNLSVYRCTADPVPCNSLLSIALATAVTLNNAVFTLAEAQYMSISDRRYIHTDFLVRAVPHWEPPI